MVTSLPAWHAPSARNHFRSNSGNHKTLKNSEAAADRRVKHVDTKALSSVGVSNRDTISDEWRYLLPISASGPFCENDKALITRKR
jgi:hypothetical protein